MIKIMHRLINSTGRYKGRIRASYITSFIKGIMMKVPMVLCFLAISLFMQDSMSKKYDHLRSPKFIINYKRQGKVHMTKLIVAS